ncbi:MAG: hypothetical protein CMP20_01465 [Rickettsiales bacterium]|nr:hypothetical protein [Rickettsiales bacterium]
MFAIVNQVVLGKVLTEITNNLLPITFVDDIVEALFNLFKLFLARIPPRRIRLEHVLKKGVILF